ncbi:MAG: polysaccharide deacetylase family protein [Chthoniobacteraceae bacterium]
MRNVAAVIVLALGIVGLGAGCKKSPQAAGAGSKSPPAVAEKATQAPSPAPSATPAPINRAAEVIVLGYHRVVDQVKAPGTEISKADFEAQMQQLKDQGITVIPMHDLLAWKRGEKDIPARSAVITMDDGWKSQYENAWPILQKFGYPFTLFIYTDYVRGGAKSGGQSISWEQIAEMRDAGADIGGHTVSHKDLRGTTKKGGTATPEYEAWLWNELNGSKQIIEQRLGVKVEALAVPFGFYNVHVQDMAKKAGYDAIFTVYGQKLSHGSRNEALGRYMIEANKPQIFASAVNFGSGISRSAAEPVAEFAPHTLATQPADNSTISDSKPLIQANLGEFGNVDPATLSMRVSSLGAVNAKFDKATKTFTFQPTRKLADNRYTVFVTGKADGKRVEARWGFTLDGSKAAPAAPTPETKKP